MSWSVYPIARFREFSEGWDVLNDRVGGLPILHSVVMAHALATLGSGREWLCIRGTEHAPEAMCILCELSAHRWQTFQPSQLPLGPWLMRPEIGYMEAVAGLFERLPGFALQIGITQQDSAMYRQPQASGTIEAMPYLQTGWIEVNSPFAEYWNQRGKHLRQNVRSQVSKLARWGVSATVERVTRPEHVADAIAEYGQLEGAGWKGLHGTAVSESNAQGRFYRSVLEDLCRLGAAHIFRLRFGTRTVAMDLCMQARGLHILLKTAYDETMKGFSPSTLLKQRVYQQVFGEGEVRRIEFFGPYMEWTSRWTRVSRPLFHVNAYRWASVALAREQMRRLSGRRIMVQAGVQGPAVARQHAARGGRT